MDDDTTTRYGVEVGRWTGLFAALWYSDVYNIVSQRRETTFTAWTRRGARAKAMRYISRETGGTQREVTVQEEKRIRW